MVLELLRPVGHRYLRGMPSNSQPPTRRRGRSRLQLQTHQVEELTRQVEGLIKRADEQDRRWFMRNVIMPISITFGGGWLFWRLPRPQPQGRDVRVSGGTDHGVRGGGTPHITPPQVVSLSAVIDGGGSVSATLTQTPVESKTATRV